MNKSMKYVAASLGVAVGISQCGAAYADANMKNTEMVYVFQNAKGEVDKIVASDWLSNPDGEDIYDQMECEEPLPVEMNISYKLDGEEIEPEELAGKSGHISIRYDFENQQETEVETEDGKKNVHVPFATVTGLLLDNDKFTNVEISNGKIVNDGDRTAVIGFAFPGLQEDLSLDIEESGMEEIPDYIELEADVNDFSMEMSATCVSNSLLEGISEIVLKEGNAKNNFIQDLSGKITDLAGGTAALKEGANTVNIGMTSLNEGIATLSTGLDTISGNSESLVAGAEQVFQTLLDTVSAQLVEAGLEVPEMTIENYGEILDGFLTQMNPETLKAQATEQITAAVVEQMGPEAENDENMKAQLEAIVTEKLNAPELQEQLAAATAGYEKISGLKASLDSYQKFYQGVTDYTGGVDKAAAGAANLLEGAGQLAEGTTKLAAGTATLEKSLSDTDIFTIYSDVENMLKAAGAYRNYSGQNSEVDGEVCFIYRTAEIG